MIDNTPIILIKFINFAPNRVYNPFVACQSVICMIQSNPITKPHSDDLQQFH